MRIRLAYGEQGLDVDLPDDLHVDVVEPRYAEGLADPAAAVEDALLAPTDSQPLRALVKPSHTVAIVVNDITRPTPYKIILPVLLRQLSTLPDERILLLVATGTHRHNTEAELRRMLGDEVCDRFRIIQNDAADRPSHRLVGTTGSCNEIWLHKDYLACDIRVLTGFIEPHFFAGFSGGGKAVMPGLALLQTILRNHSAANMDHPKATWGVTHGNPIWQEIQEAASLAPPSFLLNVTLNRNRRITRVFAGDLHKAHEAGCAYVKDSAMVAVQRPYDIVVTSNSGYPQDLNLYQAVKGMSAAARIVADGGAIIVVAECRDGIPDHGQYRRLLQQADSPASLLDAIRRRDIVEQDTWQAQVHALVCRKADVYLHSHNLTTEQIERAFLKPCSAVQPTIEQLLDSYGRDARLCILPQGPQTIPYICPRDPAQG
ncbi:MAG: nickel-dependent lactate racemase [Phycisphaerales bacterium]|nr:MAG: nickel-dependent lactate racemase [Phycisphaerales bacterium]